MNTLLWSRGHAPLRTGNTLVVALGVLSVVAAVIAISSVGATTTLRETTNAGDRLKALAAVEAVLSRHERGLLDLADSGALADFGTTTPTRAVDNNYGVDVIGNCSVRWKIEPCRTQDQGGTLDYIINPAPTGVPDSGDGHRQVNRVNFMFRISAEAAVRPSSDQPPTAVAQGARYAIAMNEPLFRYVIFYAQSGPNGDLELSHDPDITLQGDVHSNGAIYVGSGTWVNHWGAVAGPSGYTKLGPDSENNPIRVTGVDGIFCLSKPLMFGALNKFPIDGIAPNWYSSGWDWASVYQPLGGPDPGPASTLIINPKGVLDAAKFNTNVPGSVGRVRQINGIDLYSGATDGTDSRDSERRAAGKKWNPNSLTWFVNNVRTLETGGRKKPLNLGSEVDAKSRPFEPIQLREFPTPANPNTVAPELSTPMFTPSLPGMVGELPGYYFKQVIGGTANRIANGTGWVVAPTVPAPALVGLAIRERPIPDTDLWPGFTGLVANVLPPLSSLDPNYMPFAYGKHWYPTLMPFYPTWVTEGTGSTDNNPTFGYNHNAAWYAGISRSSASVNYLGKGKLLMSSACRAGPTVPSNGDDQQYYNNNWQFIHLRRPQTTATKGVNANLFIEDVSVNGSNSPGNSRHRLQGLPTASAVAAGGMGWADTAAINTTFSLGGAAAAVQNFSMRCEGFVVPGYSEMYTFGANVTTGARIWIDGRIVYEKWGIAGAVTTPIPLIRNVSYPIVVEMENDAAPAKLDVQWTCPSLSADLALATIPAANLFTRTNESFTTANWTSLVARLDPTLLTGPATMKAGIMVRPGGGGLSPLLSGRDSYLMLGYSPTRGIFTERRMAPSFVTRRNSQSWYVGPGATLNGVAVPASGIMMAPNPYTGTFIVDGVPRSQTVVRAATVAATYTVGNPYIEYEGPFRSSMIEDSEQAKNDQVSIDGRTVNVTYGYKDNGIWSKIATYSKRTLTRIEQTVRWTNADGRANFSLYRNMPISLFGPTDNTTTTTPMNPGKVIPVTGSPSSFMGDTRIYTAYSDYATMQTATPIPENNVANNAAKVFQQNWVYSEDDPGKTLPEVVDRLKALGWNGRSDWEVAPIPMSAPDTPADPGVGTPPAKPSPTVTANPFPGSYTFAINTEALAPDISVNSLVTSGGLWFTPSVSKNVPWLNTWTAASLTHPGTGSHAPNMWSNLTATPPGVSETSLQNVATSPRFADDQPASLTVNKEIWLMLTKSPTNIVSFWYYLGATPPANMASYLPVNGFGNVQLTADITGWGANLLMGPCLQSGATNAQATAFFTDLQVGSTDPGNVAGQFDGGVWDTMVPDGRNPMSSYLASQYQVLLGNVDITEDFFSFQENVPNGRTATEEGYVNPREFWSQSRWWDDGTEKDTDSSSAYIPLNANNRQLWARSTFLTLNLMQIQTYLSTTTLPQAQNLPITSATPRPAASLIDPVLKGQFNGLIYAARTNRYQWNPSPAPAPATNPFSYNSTGVAGTALPNGAANTGAATMLGANSMNDASMMHGGVHKLQPYTVGAGMDISEAPPFKPQHFHHGVRLINGSAINWGVSSGDTFGSGGTTIITPNQLFIQGNLNTQTTNVVVSGMSGLQPKNTPLSVVGDQITFLSNSFGASTTNQMDVSRLQGFVRYVPANTASNYLPPVLLAPTSVSAASNTTYVAAMITNNQPTTLARVKEGQGAPFIDTMQYLEKWGPGIKMDYKGSLVVVDSRRYTDAFLLDGPRTNGRSPFGVMGWNADWDSVLAANRWAGTVPTVYSSPDRTMSFNRDLLTDQGTPPFTPKGVTSTGLGGWTRIVK